MEIDWLELEKACAEADHLSDCVPSNAREWDVFIRQYERAVDLVEGRWYPHYDWETEDEFRAAINEQFYLGRGYKKSIYECLVDKQLFHGMDWETIKTAWTFTTTSVILSHLDLTELPRLLPKRVVREFWCNNNKLTSLAGAPKHVGGDFHCQDNQLTSLQGAPNWVGKDFWCQRNLLTTLEGAPTLGGDFWCQHNLLTTLKGAPKRVDGDFACNNNQLATLEGAPEHVGKNFWCSHNRLMTLEGAPKHVGGDFWCNGNQLTSLVGAPTHVGGNFLYDNNNLPNCVITACVLSDERERDASARQTCDVSRANTY